MAIPLTAADRTPEPGDVVRRRATGTVWRVCFVQPDYLGMEHDTGNYNRVASDYWGGLEYVSRADGGRVVIEKEGE